jgi:hypothetical protein
MRKDTELGTGLQLGSDPGCARRTFGRLYLLAYLAEISIQVLEHRAAAFQASKLPSGSSARRSCSAWMLRTTIDARSGTTTISSATGLRAACGQVEASSTTRTASTSRHHAPRACVFWSATRGFSSPTIGLPSRCGSRMRSAGISRWHRPSKYDEALLRQSRRLNVVRLGDGAGHVVEPAEWPQIGPNLALLRLNVCFLLAFSVPPFRNLSASLIDLTFRVGYIPFMECGDSCRTACCMP